MTKGISGLAPPLSAIESKPKVQADGSSIEIGNFNSHRLEITCEKLGELDAYVLDGVLSDEEGKYLIECTKKVGYTFWNSEDSRRDFRNAETIEIYHAPLARLLWERIKPHFASSITIDDSSKMQQRWQRDLVGTWDPCGTNARILFARYLNGGHFSPHTDGFDVVDFDYRSMYSIVLYLNSCKAGGGTRFYRNEQRSQLKADKHGRFTGQQKHTLETVSAVAGRMVVFYHNILHEGVPVEPEEEKYIIRSDVMYNRRDPICKTENDKKAFSLYQEAQELSNRNQVEEALVMFRKAVKLSPKLADIYGM